MESHDKDEPLETRLVRGAWSGAGHRLQGGLRTYAARQHSASPVGFATVWMVR